MLNFIKNELELLNKDNNELQELANKCILELAEVFAKQGHSGFSANYVINALFRLVKGKPLTPLTGSEDEWKEPHDNRGTRQNKRCSSVFMKEDGTCEDIEGITVSDNGGITWFTSGKLRKKVTFPYMPPVLAEKVYIEYTEDVPPGFTSDEFEVITDNPDRIKALYERKRKEFDEIEVADNAG